MAGNYKERDKEILSILTELQDPGYVVFLSRPMSTEYKLTFNREVFKFICEPQPKVKNRTSNKIIFDCWDIQYTSNAKEGGGIHIYVSRNQFIPKKHTFYFKDGNDLEKFKIYIDNLPKELEEASYTNLLTFVFLNREFDIIKKLGNPGNDKGGDADKIDTDNITEYFTKLKFYDINNSDYKKGPFTKLKWWNHYLTQMTNSIDDNYYLENKIFRMYSTEKEGTHPIMTVDHLHAFLQDYQKEHFTKEQSRIIILKHLIGEDAINKPSERPDCWLSKEFSGYLFSEENDLMDPAKSVVYQDMTKPLSEYWINSSHNTYLSGAQFMAKADTMAYSTTLRKGVRCVEIDVWDGPDAPMVFHGVRGIAVTGKLKLREVLEEIRDNAFVSSKYPVIISLENHCSIPQQRIMVDLFKKYLGDYLLTSPINMTANELPSPEELKEKIIIKHAKSDTVVKDFSGDSDVNLESEANLLQGRAFIMERTEGKWKERQFILRETALIYGTNYDTTILPVYMEPWFAGEINSREIAEKYILNYLTGVRTGDFLVRLSRGSFVLTISVRRRCQHFLIGCENNEYTVDKSTYFGSVRELIENYQKKFINNGDLKLKTPFHFGRLHEFMDWFQPDLDSETSRTFLLASKREGVFVVRKSAGVPDMFTLEFLGKNDTHKLRVPMADDMSIQVGPYSFPSLLEGINYFHYIPIYEKIRLVAPLQRESLRVEVLSDFIKSSPEERNLISGEIIEDVRFEQGKYMKDKHNLIFPADYVRVLSAGSTDTEESERKNDFDIQEKIDLIGAELFNDRVPSALPGLNDVKQCLKIIQKDKKTIFFAMEDELENWENAMANWTQAKVIKKDGSDGKKPMPNLKVKISDELSNLIVYMQAVGTLRLQIPSLYNFKQICSMPETSMTDLLQDKENLPRLVDHHKSVCTRVYPRGIRADASNYNPIPSWQTGAQMVALNFQTGDKNLHINNARFLQNGKCGYVLKPDLTTMEPVMLTIRILEARHLTSGRPHKEAILSPHVKVKIYGADSDCAQMETLHHPHVKTDKLNGFHPIWNSVFDSKIICHPKLAIIDFSVMEVNELAESFLGHASFPLSCCRSGVRSMMLRNEMDGALPIAKLLVDISLDSGESLQREQEFCMEKIREVNESAKQNPEDKSLRDESRQWMFKMQGVLQKKTTWEQLRDELAQKQSIRIGMAAKAHSFSGASPGDYLIPPDHHY